MLFFVYICFLLISSTKTVPIQKAAQTQPQYRLPQDVVKPISYVLELTLASDVFDTNTFSGVLILHFKANTTQEIKIHGNNLTFSEVKLANAQGQEVALGNDGQYAIDPVTEIITIKTKEAISGICMFTFKYVALLRTNDRYGFYKSTYKKKDGTLQPLAVTQFEAVYARRVFPCFDEPSFKAEFSITLRYPKQYNALGNTPGTTQPDSANANYKITKFEKTPVMSTYTLAFIVSDFTCDKAPQANVPHQICSRPSSASTRKYILEVGPKILRALDKFTGIKYTESGISKMDHLAIPDFQPGAMENWGIVTYRETISLWDKDHSSNKDKQKVATTVAHEMAHMWFGNLVTTHWWSDTFLNEGFATFFQFFIAAEVETSWELDKQFVLENLHAVLRAEGFRKYEPLSSPVLSLAEITSKFNLISYAKGACVIRMVQHFLGKDHFKRKINKYLTTCKFKNTKPADLWTSLGEDARNLSSGQNLETIMEKWVTQSGYPLLQVTSNGNDVVITQKRFFIDKGKPKDDEKWYVPISYTKSTDSNKFQDTSTKVWLRPSESITLKNVLVNNGWIILNNQQIGYYRVNYGDSIWKRIFKALNTKAFEGIHVLNRAQLVDDCYNLAKVGLRSYTQFLDFITFLKKDSSYFPWFAATNGFSDMLSRIENKEIRASLSNYILELMETLHKNHPMARSKNDDQIYTLNRVLAVTWACDLDLEDCTSKSLKAFEKYRKTRIKPDKNLRPVIYCSALRHSKNENADWNFLWQEFQNSDLASEQVTILKALGCVRNTKILTNYLKKAITAGSGIRQHDSITAFFSVLINNPVGVDAAIDFLVANFKSISEFYSMEHLKRVIGGIAHRFTRLEQTVKLRKLIEFGHLSESVKVIAQFALKNAIDNININKALEKELSIYFLRRAKLKETSRGSRAATLEMKMVAGMVIVMMSFR